MVKSELITAASNKAAQVSYKHMEAYINQILESMSAALVNGGRIEIRGFGSLSLHHHAPREAHNPKTKQRMRTKSKYSPYFKPGKELRKQIDDNRHIPLIDKDDAD